MKDKIKKEFFGAKQWASDERENQVNADRLMLISAVREKDKYTPLINKIAKSHKVISKNAKHIKEIHQKQLKEIVKEELAKNNVILGETNESAYTKIRRIIDIAELNKMSIYVERTNLGTYKITTEDYVNVIYEGTAKEILLIIQIISGYKKEELYKRISEKEEEEQEEMKLIENAPKYTQADFIKELEENIDKMKVIREKLNEVYKTMENFKEIVCLGEEHFLTYENIKRSIAYDESSLKEMENIFAIYLQEEQEKIKKQGEKENE